MFARTAGKSDAPEAQAADAISLLDLSAERLLEFAAAGERAATEIAASADKLAEPEDEASDDSSHDRAVANLARSLAERAQEIARGARELEQMLHRARIQLMQTAPPPAPVAKAAAEDEQTEEGPEPAEDGTGPAAPPEAALAKRVSDRFGSPGETEGRFSPREDMPPPGTPRQKSVSREGLRLLATQMAVAGSSRAEIENRLRTEFGVTDASGVLHEVLGPARGS